MPNITQEVVKCSQCSCLIEAHDADRIGGAYYCTRCSQSHTGQENLSTNEVPWGFILSGGGLALASFFMPLFGSNVSSLSNGMSAYRYVTNPPRIYGSNPPSLFGYLGVFPVLVFVSVFLLYIIAQKVSNKSPNSLTTIAFLLTLIGLMLWLATIYQVTDWNGLKSVKLGGWVGLVGYILLMFTALRNPIFPSDYHPM